MKKITFSQFIAIGFFVGFIVGIAYRLYSPALLSIGINVSKFNLLGKIYIDLIKMIVGPLIFFSICSSILSVKSEKGFSNLAFKTIKIFLFLTIISVFIGMSFAYYTKIGSSVSFDKQSIVNSTAYDIGNIKNNAKTGGLFDFVVGIIPNNIVDSFLRNDFLQVIFFACIFSIAVIRSGTYRDSVTDGVTQFFTVMSKMSDLINLFAPIGIFGISAWLFGTQDITLIKSLGILIILYYVSVLFLMYPIYGVILLFFKINPMPFFKKMLPVQFLGYVTASSISTVSLAMERANSKLGITNEKANFIIPLGATINMNGGAIYLGMCSIFIANMWGINLGIFDYFTIFFLSIIGAIGTAPIPGSCIFLIAGILVSVGLPIEGIAIIVAIDRIFDMMRTVCNISGDSLTALVVDKIDNTLDKKVYYGK